MCPDPFLHGNSLSLLLSSITIGFPLVLGSGTEGGSGECSVSGLTNDEDGEVREIGGVNFCLSCWFTDMLSVTC